MAPTHKVEQLFDDSSVERTLASTSSAPLYFLSDVLHALGVATAEAGSFGADILDSVSDNLSSVLPGGLIQSSSYSSDSSDFVDSLPPQPQPSRSFHSSPRRMPHNSAIHHHEARHVIDDNSLRGVTDLVARDTDGDSGSNSLELERRTLTPTRVLDERGLLPDISIGLHLPGLGVTVNVALPTIGLNVGVGNNNNNGGGNNGGGSGNNGSGGGNNGGGSGNNGGGDNGSGGGNNGGGSSPPPSSPSGPSNPSGGGGGSSDPAPPSSPPAPNPPSGGNGTPPSSPSDPTDPTNPTNPTNPSDPSDPSNPANPNPNPNPNPDPNPNPNPNPNPEPTPTPTVIVSANPSGTGSVLVTITPTITPSEDPTNPGGTGTNSLSNGVPVNNERVTTSDGKTWIVPGPTDGGTFSSYPGMPTSGPGSPSYPGGGGNGGTGDPNGGNGGGGIGGSAAAKKGLSTGALAAIIALLTLFVLFLVVVGLRRKYSQRREDRYRGWSFGASRNGEDGQNLRASTTSERSLEDSVGAAGFMSGWLRRGPKDQRRISDDSFATPEVPGSPTSVSAHATGRATRDGAISATTTERFSGISTQSGLSSMSVPWATGLSSDGSDLISIGSSHSHDGMESHNSEQSMTQLGNATPASFAAMYRSSQNVEATYNPISPTESVVSPTSPAPLMTVSPSYSSTIQASSERGSSPTQSKRASRGSQLTIKPAPYKPPPPSSWNAAAAASAPVADPFADEYNPARESLNSMTSTQGRPSINSVDLMAFPRPPSVLGSSTSSTDTVNLLRPNRSILRPNSQLGAQGYTSSLSPVLQSPSQTNLLDQNGNPTPSPAREDFEYAYDTYGALPPTNRASSNSVPVVIGSPMIASDDGHGGRDSSEQEVHVLVDPFSDGLDVPLPSPMASSAARSLFFPQDYSKVEGAYTTVASLHRNDLPTPTNITRVARAWAPTGDNPEEMAVKAGDVVHVISRHSLYPQLDSDGSSSSSREGPKERDTNATLGGWALVKKTDPANGIGRRGFVPVNCLMDV